MNGVEAHNRAARMIQQHQLAGGDGAPDEAVELLRESLRLGRLRATYAMLASVLLHRFEARGDRRDLDESWQLLATLADSSEGIDLVQGTDIVRARRHLYDLDGGNHLDDAIRIASWCVAHAPPEAPAYGLMQHLLGLALGDRYQLTGQPRDLQGALAAHRASVHTSPDDGNRPGLLLNLASSLRVSYDVTQDPATLGEALDVVGKAKAVLPAGHPLHATADHLAGLLGRYRYEVSGDASEIPASVEALRQSVRTTADPHDRGVRQASLGAALLRQFENTGDTALLTESIEVMRESLHNAGSDLPKRQHNLAAALRERYQYFGDLQALKEAIVLLREAGAHATLSIALQDLCEREPSAWAVDEAVAAARSAATVEDTTDAVERLANALRARAAYNGDGGDLAEAYGLLEQVLARRPAGTAGHARVLGNLGGLWTEEHHRADTDEALHQAITYLGQAIRADPQPEPQRARYQYDYAMLLLLDTNRTGDLRGLPAVVRASADAAANEALEPLTRALAASNWSVTAAQAGDRVQATRGAALAMTLIDHVTTRRLARTDRENGLSQLAGVAADAAACALNDGDAELALQWLEQGRGVLMAQTFEASPDLTALQEHRPDLAARYAEVTDELEDLDLVAAPSDVRHATAARRDELLHQIRQLPGHEGFLRPPSRDELFECAQDGPVVLLNVSNLRCDALIVFTDMLITVPLPELTIDAATAQAERFSVALEASVQPGQELAAGQAITEVLEWLLDDVVAPVLGYLPRGTHVWWSPGGPLSALPLHAAGRDGYAALDHVVSSYTPTVRALGRARSLARRPVQAPRMLVVAMPETEGHAPLRYARDEANALADLWGAQELSGTHATRDNVLQALQQHSYVHFACHGVSDVDQPADSRLLVHGTPLTVLDVSRLRLPNARLAVLSACHTARTTAQLADEAVHLAGAFQLAGYPSVVGTLWQVNDRIARDVAIAFHSTLRERGPEHAAQALHDVLNGLRTQYPASLWAAFLHTGA